MRLAVALIACILLDWQQPTYAQPREVPPIEIKPSVPPIVDSVHEEDYYVRANSDSARIFDSIYAVRRAEIMARMKNNPYTPQETFLSARLMSTAFGRYRAKELQRYFAERVGRTDLDDESGAFTGLDRMISLLGEARLTSSLGVFAQYSYTGKYYQTNVLTSPDSTRVPKGMAELDVVSHDFTVGPTAIPFSTSFVQLKLYAGLGPALLNIREFEQASGVERTATAGGLAIAFEVEFDFQVVDEVSFGLTLFTKQVTSGELEVNNAGLSSPFGSRTWTTETNPDGSFATAGLGIAVHYYF